MAPRPTASKADQLQTPDTSMNPSRDEVTGQLRSQKAKEAPALPEQRGQGHHLNKYRASHCTSPQEGISPKAKELLKADEGL